MTRTAPPGQSFMDRVQSAGLMFEPIYRSAMNMKHEINEERDNHLTEAELMALLELEEAR